MNDEQRGCDHDFAEADAACMQCGVTVHECLVHRSDCRIGFYCQLHGEVHGGEAEELRSRIEALINDPSNDDFGEDGYVTVEVLQALLDDVDAKDSAAFLEVITCKVTKQQMDKSKGNT